MLSGFDYIVTKINNSFSFRYKRDRIMPKKVFNSTNRRNDFQFALVSQCLLNLFSPEQRQNSTKVVLSSDYIVLYWFIDMPIGDSVL